MQDSQQYLPALKAAVARKAGLSLEYQRRDGKISAYNAVYPRQVVNRNRQWYLHAYVMPYGRVFTFRVDRIRSLREFSGRQRAYGVKHQRFRAIRAYSPAVPPLALSAALVGFGAYAVAQAILGGVVVVSVCYALWTLSGGNPRGRWVQTTKLIDGDTFGVGRGWRYEKVRLIGVDAPETVHPHKPVERFGPEASRFTAELVGKRKVSLQFDRVRRYDRYGRLRAYVFTLDGLLVNRELVKHGYAHVVDKIRFSRYEDFKACERQARRRGAGIWSVGKPGHHSRAGMKPWPGRG